MYKQLEHCIVLPEILPLVIKFVGLVPNDLLYIIGGFKFGGMVLYCHRYMHCTVEILAV